MDDASEDRPSLPRSESKQFRDEMDELIAKTIASSLREDAEGEASSSRGASQQNDLDLDLDLELEMEEEEEQDVGQHEASEEDSSSRDLEILGARLSAGVASSSNAEARPHFELLDRPRVLVHAGKVYKVGTEALVKRDALRSVFVLSDCVLVCAEQSTDELAPLELKKVIDFEEVIHFEDLRWDFAASHRQPCFALVTTQRSFRFLSNDLAEHDKWVLSVGTALASYKSREMDYGFAGAIGWRHTLVRGSLHSAAFIGDNSLDRIIKAGQLDARDPEGLCAIHYAAYAGDVRTVRLLLDAGADVCPHAELEEEEYQGFTPLHFAAAHIHGDVVTELIKRDTEAASKVDACGRTPFFVCATSVALEHLPNASQLLQTLLTDTVNVDDVDCEDKTPLMHCAEKGFARSANLLLRDCKADAHIRDKQGRTALHLASLKSDVETVQALLDQGARPNLIEHDGNTPLDLADGHVASELVRKGARMPASEGKAAQEWLAKQLPSQSLTPTDSWVNDQTHPHCMLCEAAFTIKRRRHHCRLCGSLCCSFCSDKKLLLDSKPHRCCDACFNKAFAAAPASLPPPPEHHQAEARSSGGTASRRKTAGAALRRSLFGGGHKEAPPAPSTPQDTVAEGLDLMRERGEHLGRLAEQSSQLEDGARDFRQAARKLRRQTEHRWI